MTFILQSVLSDKEQKIWIGNYAKNVSYFLLLSREVGDVCTQTMSPLFGKKTLG